MANGDDLSIGLVNNGTNETLLEGSPFVVSNVTGFGTVKDAIVGESGYGVGVVGRSLANLPGVIGLAGPFAAVKGTPWDFTGSSAVGVVGQGATGVSGKGVTNGVVGSSDSGTGVNGSGRIGVSGSGDTGVYGSSDYTGVYGYAEGRGGVGIYGHTEGERSIAIYGYGGHDPAEPGLAGWFDGSVLVTGHFRVLGVKSAVVEHPDGEHRQLYCMESPESWFEDFGQGKLVRGKGKVKLEPQFGALVRKDEYHVFLTPMADSNGLYVSKQDSTGFEVREQKGGKSDLRFSYRVVAKRKDIQGRRLEKVQMPARPKPIARTVKGARARGT